jgi:hypothetical protein
MSPEAILVDSAPSSPTHKMNIEILSTETVRNKKHGLPEQLARQASEV